MSVTDELLQIAANNNGLLRPESVVEYAKSPETALHGHFDWDDSEASAKWRLHQARQIIKVSVSVVAGTNEHHKVFVSLREDRSSGNGYRLLVDVMSDEELRSRLLRQAKEDFDYWKKKYHSLEELVPVFESMEKVVSAF